MSEPAAATTAPTRQPVKGRESPVRISLYIGGGLVALYLATWSGAAGFYWSFQRPLLEIERGPERGVLSLAPRPAPPGGLAGWSAQEVSGAIVWLPPARIESAKGDATLTRLTLEEESGAQHTVDLEWRPRGFVASVLREKLELLGCAAEPAASDADALRVIADERLDSYSFASSEAERSRYAARILAKMSLWDTLPVRRFEAWGDSGAFGVLEEKPAGAARIILASEKGALIVSLPAGAPAGWKTAAGWLAQ